MGILAYKKASLFIDNEHDPHAVANIQGNMYPNIYVASFGDFYFSRRHQYVLKYWIQELTAVLGMALKFMSALFFKAMQKELNGREKNKRCREESLARCPL